MLAELTFLSSGLLSGEVQQVFSGMGTNNEHSLLSPSNLSSVPGYKFSSVVGRKGKKRNQCVEIVALHGSVFLETSWTEIATSGLQALSNYATGEDHKGLGALTLQFQENIKMIMTFF